MAVNQDLRSGRARRQVRRCREKGNELAIGTDGRHEAWSTPPQPARGAAETADARPRLGHSVSDGWKAWQRPRDELGHRSTDVQPSATGDAALK